MAGVKRTLRRSRRQASWALVSQLILLAAPIGRASASLFGGVDDSVASSSSSSIIEKETRIIGGLAAEDDRYPYSVSLISNGRHGCGGTLIARDVVLTAAHCLRGSLTVTIGTDRLDDNGGEQIPVLKTVEHPQYNDSTDRYDIGLLFLSYPTSLNVPFPVLNQDATFPIVGSTTHVMGWGDTDGSSEEQNFPNMLHVVDLQVLSNTMCEMAEATRSAEEGGATVGYDGWIYEDMLCTSREGKDACQGDSGGPLIVKNNSPQTDVLVGIVSWGVGCAFLPGVFSRVSTSYEWIVETMCTESNSAPVGMCGTPSPTDRPITRAPTERPTVRPTIRPTTYGPTFVPTTSPTWAPSLSYQPTASPTIDPTSHPTKHPTMQPIVTPSMPPSVMTSLRPSLSPTPTIYPTKSSHPTPTEAPIDIRKAEVLSERISGKSMLFTDLTNVAEEGGAFNEEVEEGQNSENDSSCSVGHSFAIVATLLCGIFLS